MPSDTSSTLYIRMGREGFIFACRDNSDMQMLNYVPFKLKLDVSANVNMHDAMQTVPLLKRSYDTVKVLSEAPSTLVPLDLFEEEEAESLFSYNFPSELKRYRVMYDVLPRLEAVLLFGPDRDLCHTVRETFQNARFVSIDTPVLRHFAACSPRAFARVRRYFSIDGDRLMMASFEGGALRMYNVYHVHSAQDALYYALYVCKQFPLGADDEILVTGCPEQADALSEGMKTYVGGVFRLRASDEYGVAGAALEKVFPYDMIVQLLSDDI